MPVGISRAPMPRAEPSSPCWAVPGRARAFVAASAQALAVLLSVATALDVAPAQAASGRALSLTPRNLSPAADTSEAPDAEALFVAGEAAYEAGDFAAAADYFARAQTQVPHPATLYNLGMAQHRAGQPLAAHATFVELQAVATSPEERAEADAAQERVRRELASVIVVVDPAVTVCLDEQTMAPREGETRERLTVPGPHALEAFGESTNLDLHPGETQRVWLDGWEQAAKRGRPRKRRLATALMALAGAGGAAAVGAGVGAAVARDRQLTLGLGVGAAVAGAIALVSAASSIGVLRRERATASLPRTTCAAKSARGPSAQQM